MVNRPTVTVIIVTHNSASHLPQCIDAVYKSARQLVSQIIVVDNASSDQTPQVAAQFEWCVCHQVRHKYWIRSR